MAMAAIGLVSTSKSRASSKPAGEKTVKILLDTDIGSDIDDAVCLAYLLANPQCELLGITTVTGEAVKRAQMASALCKIAGKKVPIYPGAENPLLIAQRQTGAPQARQLSNWRHQTDFPKNDAVAFMRRTIRNNPGEIILLPVGPLTNVALLFATDPEIPSLLKGLVTMCGKFTVYPSPWGSTEWNAILDPHATAVVFRSRPPFHRTVGLDVTLQVKMTPNAVKERFKGIPILEPVYDFSKVWFEQREYLHFHDPLAATTIFNDGICRFERGSVSIDLKNEDTLGQTLYSPGSGPHQVATDVDPQAFFQEYFSVFV